MDRGTSNEPGQDEGQLAGDVAGAASKVEDVVLVGPAEAAEVLRQNESGVPFLQRTCNGVELWVLHSVVQSMAMANAMSLAFATSGPG